MNGEGWEPIETAPDEMKLFIVKTEENDKYNPSFAIAYKRRGRIFLDTTRELGNPTHWKKIE